MVPIAFAALIGVLVNQDAPLRFSGRTWIARQPGVGGPGPNEWDPKQVWVDSAGALHLRISQIDGQWRCAQLWTTERLGFGTYRFEIEGPIDRLDRNVVLGLFNYPTPDLGPDTTNEIDIEFARWGNEANPIGNYTVWPLAAGAERWTRTFVPTLKGNRSTHTFTWTSTGVRYESTVTPTIEFHPSQPDRSVAQKPMPLHLNLWLFQGKPPSDGKPIEIVVHSVRYTPINAATSTR